ncbi:hypothetical protein SmJEL517_g00940 [Synchytrium microbalum]|uniref:PWI domain-containing protein n=1 Tax=Synchytrium microbalum TaxID=1806994 RepID=A0A507CBX8_9FUNG|nr:uncharacterized protein SmJEL517_g00940 [Synchytrium microbalum]TPX37122.1 hypothetical protein SmJEL517_g00940 [Synchytrium microbalum]
MVVEDSTLTRRSGTLQSSHYRSSSPPPETTRSLSRRPSTLRPTSILSTVYEKLNTRLLNGTVDVPLQKADDAEDDPPCAAELCVVWDCISSTDECNQWTKLGGIQLLTGILNTATTARIRECALGGLGNMACHTKAASAIMMSNTTVELICKSVATSSYPPVVLEGTRGLEALCKWCGSNSRDAAASLLKAIQDCKVVDRLVLIIADTSGVDSAVVLASTKCLKAIITLGVTSPSAAAVEVVSQCQDHIRILFETMSTWLKRNEEIGIIRALLHMLWMLIRNGTPVHQTDVDLLAGQLVSYVCVIVGDHEDLTEDQVSAVFSALMLLDIMLSSGTVPGRKSAETFKLAASSPALIAAVIDLVIPCFAGWRLLGLLVPHILTRNPQPDDPVVITITARIEDLVEVGVEVDPLRDFVKDEKDQAASVNTIVRRTLYILLGIVEQSGKPSKLLRQMLTKLWQEKQQQQSTMYGGPPTLGLPFPRPSPVISAPPSFNNAGPGPISTPIQPRQQPAVSNEKPEIVFIAKIPDGVADEWIERLCKICGPFRQWRRLKDSNDVARPCGFALFEGKEGPARALRVLGAGDGIELPSPLPSRPSRKLKVVVDQAMKKEYEDIIGDDSAAIQELPKMIAELEDSTIAAILDKADKAKNAEFLANAATYGNRNLLDDLKDEDINPEHREMIRSEIRSFRTNAAIRDLAKEENKLKEEFDRRARDERDRERERERVKLRGVAGATGAPERVPVGGSSSTNSTSNSRDVQIRERGSMIVDEEDEEEELKREERRKRDMELAFKERERRWEAREEHTGRQRADQYARDELWLSQRQKDRANAEVYFRDYDDEVAENELFYVNREKWFARRTSFRTREQEQDARDRRIAQQEAERKQAVQQQASSSARSAGGATEHGRQMSVDLDDEAETAAADAPVVIGRIMTKDERNAAKKDLIESLPVDKEGLFGWKVQWHLLDEHMIREKFNPWVTKRLEELMGGHANDLIASIIAALAKHTSPQKQVEDLALPLDDDAELFVMKLWRLLVFETESRAAGLS